MSIGTRLEHLMLDTISAQPVTKAADGSGDTIDNGSPTVIKCRYEGGGKLVRTPEGKEVVSMVRAITTRHNGLDVENWRYTLPSRYDPNDRLTALMVIQHSSKSEAEHHETVVFP